MVYVSNKKATLDLNGMSFSNDRFPVKDQTFMTYQILDEKAIERRISRKWPITVSSTNI